MRALCLARYPEGDPQPDDFVLRELPDPVPGAGEVLVKVTHLSMDPLPRVRMQKQPPMGPPMRLDAPVEGRGVGRVVATSDPSFAVGDTVLGELGWQSLCALPAARLTRIEGGRPSQHLNALGPTGLAAWFVTERLAPQGEQTLLVAPAAGAVGSLVCQIARARAPGLRIYGTAMGQNQTDYLEAIGVTPISSDDDWSGPHGIDLFVDGVGGAFHDRMLCALHQRAKVVLLGFVSAYGEQGPPSYGNAGSILLKRLQMEGFLLADHMQDEGAVAQARAQIAAWLNDGTLTPAEQVHQGLASAADAFAGLFRDSPPGKQIVEMEEAE
ncbi:MAG: NADP-dependent oxidoreductase [Erythrobacter sp.]|jgi:NADPH-dependent curcumin reductase CurA|nr:NADP-dependent oxidoreductase [Erythrobacter sp.]